MIILMNQKGFSIIFISIGILVITIMVGGAYYLVKLTDKTSQNPPQQSVNQPSQTPTLEKSEKSRASLPPKIDFKLPEGWQYKKNENPIISAKPLWYSYGDINNSNKLNSQELSNIQKFTISVLFYENTPGTNVSGIEEEGIHGGGNSLKYEKPEKIALGDKNFTKQISYTPTAGRDYEGSGFHSPDDKIYTYSYSINSDFLVIHFYYNINNPDKEKLQKDLDLFLSSIELE